MGKGNIQIILTVPLKGESRKNARDRIQPQEVRALQRDEWHQDNVGEIRSKTQNIKQVGLGLDVKKN